MKTLFALVLASMSLIACADDDFTIAATAPVVDNDTGKFGGGNDADGMDSGADGAHGDAVPTDSLVDDTMDSGGSSDTGRSDGSSSDADSGSLGDSSGRITPFPTAGATAYCKLNGSGSPFTLGYCKDFGDYVEEQVSHSSLVTRVTFDVPVYSSMTTSPTTCGIGVTYRFDAFVGVVRVGELSFVGESTPGVIRMKGSFSIAPTAPIGGKVKLRIEAKTTVCDGGGSWKWVDGGKVVFE